MNLVVCDRVVFRLDYCRFVVNNIIPISGDLASENNTNNKAMSSSIITDSNSSTTINQEVLYFVEKQRHLYAISVPILLVYTLLVFLINATILLTVPFIKGKLNLTLKLTVSLTLADIWTSAMVAFSLTYNSYLHYVYGLSTNACLATTIEVMKLAGFFCSILHLLTLAVNHYLSTAHPFLGRKLMTPTSGTVIIATLWLLPTAAVSTGFSLVPGQGYQTPGGTCTNHSFLMSFEFRTIILSLICILIAAMSALYVSVLVALARVKRKLSALRKSSPQRACQQYANNRKTFVTTLLIWGTFFLGWFPSSLLFVLTCEHCPFGYRNKDHYFTVYAFGVSGNFCILSKTLVNPIIYAVRIPEIKTVLKQWRRKRRQLVITGGNNSHYDMPPLNRRQQSRKDNKENGKKNVRTVVPRWSAVVQYKMDEDGLNNKEGENIVLLDSSDVLEYKTM